MQIQLHKASKRFKKNWIFKDLDILIPSGEKIALTGHNGSGKSTLLKCIAGFEHLTKGEIAYSNSGLNISKEELFSHFTFSAPYQELIREMKLCEFLAFHQDLDGKIEAEKMLDLVGLQGNNQKYLDDFSSGMLQRLKLGLSFFTHRPLILLDEPTSNLDSEGKNLFKDLMLNFSHSKTIILASNESFEIDLCQKTFSLV